MKPAGDVLAVCVGGRNDGETILLRPQGSIGPPIRLSFLEGMVSGAYVWSTYEMDIPQLPVWPDTDRTRQFHWLGLTTEPLFPTAPTPEPPPCPPR